MSYRVIDNVHVWGSPDAGALQQAIRCSRVGDVAFTGLMADHHKGYSQPIGGVVAYHGFVSPSGVGYDIGCGNLAVRTDLKAIDIRPDLAQIMDEISTEIAFGVGRENAKPIDHPLFDDPTWTDVPELRELIYLARQQLGTVGSGNHYVDIFEETASGNVWVGCHFGSRGFGHKVASGFINLAAGRPFNGKTTGESMDQDPVLLPVSSGIGQAYLAAMKLAGAYAEAGRNSVIGQVLRILGTTSTDIVHNHHNFAWLERQPDGETVCVVRKGATPLFPGQRGFVGGSMGDISVIIRGVDSAESRTALYSTIHGAGRVMSRTQAAGKKKWVNGKAVHLGGGLVDMDVVRRDMASKGVELRGAGADEAPTVYRSLANVLAAHAETLEVCHVLTPLGVAMAGANEFDPYKD